MELGYPHDYYVLPGANATFYGGTFDRIDSHLPSDMPENLLALVGKPSDEPESTS